MYVCIYIYIYIHICIYIYIYIHIQALDDMKIRSAAQQIPLWICFIPLEGTQGVPGKWV